MRKQSFILALFLIFITNSCKQNIAITGCEENGNLIKNCEFNEWDEFWKPSSWGVLNNKEEDKYVRPYDKSTIGTCVSVFKNSKSPRYIYQEIKVKRNTYYYLSSDMNLNIDNVKGGIYILESDSGKLISKYETVYKQDSEELKILFNSSEANSISIRIGFMEKGLGGSLHICNIQLTEVLNKKQIFESEAATLLVDRLNLKFTNENEFYNSILKISRFVNSALLAERRKDSIGMNDLIIIRDIFHSSLNQDKSILNQSPNEIIIAYEQKSVIILNKILDLFNIDSYIINFHRDGKRVHTILEFYNPFVKNNFNFVDLSCNISIITKKRDLQNLKHNIKSNELGGIYSSKDVFLSKVLGAEMSKSQSYKLTFPF